MKLSGNVNNDCNVLIFDEENFELEYFGPVSTGSFSVNYLKNFNKSIVTDDSDGRSVGYGNVEVVDDTTNEYQNLEFVQGTLYTCGRNNYGQLGQNDLVSRSVLTKVGSNVNWTNVSCGSGHFIGLQSNGTIWGCGGNTSGQLGQNNRINYSTPTRIGLSNMWRNIFTKGSSSYFLHDDYSLWACGNNGNGQLGLNDRLSRSTVTKIGTSTDWRKVACGAIYTIGIKSDGTMWSWGSNNNGVLGLGDTLGRSTPTKIGTDTDWEIVSCSNYQNFALKTNGSLWVWGQNNNGQLGLGDLNNRSTPTMLGISTDWKNVGGGGTEVLLVKGDRNELWSFGSLSENGSLGYPSSGNISSPTTALIVRNGWKKLCPGTSYLGLAIRHDNTMWSFGSNTHGQIGHGNLVSTSTPTKVGSYSNWYTASGGYSFFAAIRTES